MSKWDGSERRKLPDIDVYKEILERLNSIELQNATMQIEQRGTHKAFRDFEFEVKEFNAKINKVLFEGNGEDSMKTQLAKLKGIPDKVDRINLKIASWSGGTIAIVFLIKFLFKI